MWGYCDRCQKVFLTVGTDGCGKCPLCRGWLRPSIPPSMITVITKEDGGED